jgi:hypothetical protein
MLILRLLNLDPRILRKRHHHWGYHHDREPEGTRVLAPRPQTDEIPPEHDVPAEDVPEDDHLVSTDSGHQPGQLPFTPATGHYPIDQRDEQIRQNRGHQEEQVLKYTFKSLFERAFICRCFIPSSSQKG